MADQGLISTSSTKDGKRVYSITKRFDGKKPRVVEFFIGKLVEKDTEDPIEAMEDEYDDRPIPESVAEQLEMGGGFISMEDDGNEALPF